MAKKWLAASGHRPGDIITDKGSVTIPAPIAKVENVLARAMKARPLLTAVTFSGGKIEEVHRNATDGEASGIIATAKAAVTVAQPTIGCPCPEFEKAEVRATRVLRQFLTPAQLDDFDRTQSFVVVGADSGHRYLLTSRSAGRERLAKVDGRSVFDVTEGRSVCVHDWTVPASEELLELALFLQLPARERYVRGLPEAFGE